MSIRLKMVPPKLNNKNIYFPVIGIGASAGGLEAIKTFLKGIPSKTGVAFVFIQHRDTSNEMILPEILKNFTELEVCQIKDKTRIMPDTFYVTPAQKNISIIKGKLYVSDPLKKTAVHLPIDFFFTSLAHDRAGKSIGIILSGMGMDGTLGVKEIKKNSGIVMVQDTNSAVYDEMPRNAIGTGLMDYIGTPEELSEELLFCVNQNSTPDNHAAREGKKSEEGVKKIGASGFRVGHA
ncbi:MAG: chemotaxis protein CheB [Spirochaetales bacterium]|nr:chemotaxis protein CheB [Spirochaetales bacterium]